MEKLIQKTNFKRLIEKLLSSNTMRLAPTLNLGEADLMNLSNTESVRKLLELFSTEVDSLELENFTHRSYIEEKDRYHSSLSEVLRYLMNDVGGISECELSRRTNVPQPTINRMLSGKTPNPRLDSLQPLAAFFCVSTDQLLSRVPLPADRILGTFYAEVSKPKIIPVISWHEAISWPNYLPELPGSEFPKSVTADSYTNGSFALEVKNNCLFPELRDSIILIDTNFEPKEGHYIVAYIHGRPDAILGKLVVSNQTYYILAGYNSNDSIMISNEDRLIGRIVESRKNWE